MEAALKRSCLACGHENQATDKVCAACGSTLNLRLCTACEAINSEAAETCHACGAPCVDRARPVSGNAAPPQDAPEVHGPDLNTYGLNRSPRRMPMVLEQAVRVSGY